LLFISFSRTGCMYPGVLPESIRGIARKRIPGRTVVSISINVFRTDKMRIDNDPDTDDPCAVYP